MRERIIALFGLFCFFVFVGVGNEILSILTEGQIVSVFVRMGLIYRIPSILHTNFIKLHGTTQSMVVGVLCFVAVIDVFVCCYFHSHFLKDRKLTSSGTSRLATIKELKNAGLFSRHGVVLCQTNEAKTSVIKNNTPGKISKYGHILVSDDLLHTFIVGPTRSGKGVNNVIPTLLTWKGALFVYDIKEENYNYSSGFRNQFSHVYKFNPTNEISNKFNPLLEIEKGYKDVSMAQNFAEILAGEEAEKSDPHWRSSAVHVLSGLILWVLYEEKEKTLNRIYQLLSSLDLKATIDQMCSHEHMHIKTTGGVMAVKNEKEFASIVSTAIVYLTLFSDPIIAKNTSESDFCIDDLFTKDIPGSFYFIVKPNDLKRMAPLTRIIIEQITARLQENFTHKKHNTLLLLDEFPTLGRMKQFESKISHLAGFGVRCVIVAQNLGQIERHYTRYNDIFSNCYFKIILTCASIEDADAVAKFLGEETILKKNESRNKSMKNLLYSSKSESFSEIGRPLFTRDEILRLDFRKVILLQQGSYPYVGKKIFYYLDKRFSFYKAFPPPPCFNGEKPISQWVTPKTREEPTEISIKCSHEHEGIEEKSTSDFDNEKAFNQMKKNQKNYELIKKEKKIKPLLACLGEVYEEKS